MCVLQSCNYDPLDVKDYIQKFNVPKKKRKQDDVCFLNEVGRTVNAIQHLSQNIRNIQNHLCNFVIVWSDDGFYAQQINIKINTIHAQRASQYQIKVWGWMHLWLKCMYVCVCVFTQRSIILRIIYFERK